MTHTVLRRWHHEAQGAVRVRRRSCAMVGGVKYLISCKSRNDSSGCSRSADNCSSISLLPETDDNGDETKVGACVGWPCELRVPWRLVPDASSELEPRRDSWCGKSSVRAKERL